MSKLKKFNQILQEFSIPLILGVVTALIWANVSYETYDYFVHASITGEKLFFGHVFNFHFVFNDFFMVFFFGIAAVEITKAVIPGGDLSPINKAMNPIFGCLGGVFGPVVAFFILAYLFNFDSILATGVTMTDIYNGWGIPTATDIALAWLLASFIFGKKHPAVSFLLILAIIDDAIGLVIIAIFYPSPDFPVAPAFLLLNVLAMFIAFVLRMRNIHNISLYLLGPGVISWCGLFFAHLHPALALVFVVPFMPNKIDKSLHEREIAINRFEHKFKYFVDLGLFGFGLANAGVLFSGINSVTWVIFLSLFVGKTAGIFLFSSLGKLIGFPFPKHVGYSSLIVIGMIAGLGLTVALFVAGEAYTSPLLQGPAKMGALFSALVAIPAIIIGRFLLRIERIDE